ncbi:MAG: 23S rRNA pseudouridine2457 synthase [Marivirga sp.]|jgi:23S rRNA pseudouridine2457 synthase
MASHHHYMLHKPYGYLSQFINNQSQRKNKKLLGALYEFAEHTMSIGRLDEKSEGLLLLTTDGKLSDDINSSKVEKEYYVQVDGLIEQATLEQLAKGIEIKIRNDFYTTKPAKVKLLDKNEILEKPANPGREERHGLTSWISITLREGKYRQIRKMTAAVNHPTLRLVRIRIGDMHLTSLKVGETKELSSLDI